MGLNLGAVQVIVYDLDGTIYDDTRHFALYAHEIQSHLPEDLHDAFWADYEAVTSGQHPALRIGSFYDARHDLVLLTKAGRVELAMHWDGSVIPSVLRDQLYPGLIEPDHSTVLNVGDLWWVPSAISLHHGGDPEKHQVAFYRIREIMSDPNFIVRAIPGLQEMITGLKGKVIQVLATNSPQPDSEAILDKVGLTGLFDAHYFQSNKPAGLRQIFAELTEAHGMPADALLSVGDNLVNEIAPARTMGCQTVFIDPFGTGELAEADMVVQSMEELIPLLKGHYGLG